MKNKKIVWIGSLLGILLWVMNSCYYDEVIPVEPSADVFGEVLFATDIIPIFNQSCNISGCHDGTIDPDLFPSNAYNSLINDKLVNTATPEESDIYLKMSGKESPQMPPSGANANDAAKILAWIKQGALNN